jgi:hypothetical protein
MAKVVVREIAKRFDETVAKKDVNLTIADRLVNNLPFKHRNMVLGQRCAGPQRRSGIRGRGRELSSLHHITRNH